jgi:AsmA protein
MPRPLKFTAWLAAIVLGLALILALYLMLSFDPNNYRDEITARIEAETGRTLTLEDDIELQFFPTIGLRLGATQLSGPASFTSQDFIAVRSANINVRLLPLLKQRLEVDTIVLHGLDINLVTDKNGSNNWDFANSATASDAKALPGTDASPASPPDVAATLAKLHIKGIDVRDATLNWFDVTSQSRVRLDELALTTGPIGLGTPIDINLSFKLSGTPLPAEQTLALHLNALTLLDLDRQTLELSQLKLQVGDLSLSGTLHATQLNTSPTYSSQIDIPSFPPKPLLQQLGITLPESQDKSVWHSISAGLKISGDTHKVDVNDLNIHLDDTTLTGQASLKLEPHVATSFTLAINTLDADRYLPPATAAVSENSIPASTNPATFDLPLDTLRTLDLQGQVLIGTVKIAGLNASNISAKLSARDGLIRLQPVQADLYQGKARGSLQLDARKTQPRFSIQQTLEGFQAEPFLHDLLDNDLISGQAALKLDITTLGNSVDALTRNLNGNARFDFSDGAIKGLNIADMVRRAQAKIEKRPIPDPAVQQTDFTNLSASIMLNNGVASNKDLSAQAPLLRISGEGKADLVNSTIDYHLRAKIVEEASGQGGTDLASLRGTTIPILIRGPLTAPEIKLDSAVIKKQLQKEAQQTIKEEIHKQQDQARDKLKQKLKKLF